MIDEKTERDLGLDERKLFDFDAVDLASEFREK
jgi:hypothetical protein